MKQKCRNCHFLCKTHRSESGETFDLSWTSKDRSNGKITTPYSSSCYLKVWDTGIDPSINTNLVNVIDENRKNVCFFMAHKPGMSFHAAKVLQERKSENAQLKRTNLYTQIGLWIAALALIANLLVAVFKN